VTNPASSDLRGAARAAQRRTRRAERRRRRKVRRSVLWRWRRALYLVAVLTVAGLAGGLAVVSRVQLEEADPLAQTTYVCAADVESGCGPTNALASFRAEIDREVVAFTDVPPLVVQAVLAAEDRDFFRHGGVDPLGIGRAVLSDIRSRSALQGGSTITQQYVKNAFLTQDRTMARKLREAVLAVKLERKLSKEEILTRYLNTIYFGRGAYGVQAAAYAYFGGGLATITGDAPGLAKAAYLAGLIRSPETADATIDPAEADFRRRSVLDGMVEERSITPEQAAAAAAVPFETLVTRRTERSGLGPVRGAETGNAYFVDYVRQWLLNHFDGDAQRVFAGGLRVYTTLDYGAQAAAYQSIYGADEGVLADPANPAGSLVALDETGRVVAMVGGRDFDQSQVNLAVGQAGGGSGRQPGSTFKPFALAATIEDGQSPLSRYPAPSKVVFPGVNDGEDWSVSGGGSTTGNYDLLDALAQSSNTVYAQLMVQLGADRVVQLAERMGITATLPAVPALVLGSGEVSVLDMASAYSTFANRGAHVDPVVVSRIEDSSGNVLYRSRYEPQTVLQVATADAVTTAMRAVIADGTGTNAQIPRDAAGKTGTTEDHRDAWFVGYTCTGPETNLTAAVWMGYPGTEGQPVASMSDVQGVHNVGGGTFPAKIWSTFMSKVTDGRPDCQLPNTTKFPGERRDVREVQGGKVPAGGFPTTTTASTTTTVPPSTTTSDAPGASVPGAGSTSTSAGERPTSSTIGGPAPTATTAREGPSGTSPANAVPGVDGVDEAAGGVTGGPPATGR
jgi:penicillin-binding protein 1A